MLPLAKMLENILVKQPFQKRLKCSKMLSEIQKNPSR